MHNGGMFLRCTLRVKDGKEHRYWSIVENRRGSSRRVVQRQVLYLGEINDSQKATWCRCIEVFEEPQGEWHQVALFPEDRQAPELTHEVVHVRLSELQVKRSRQWGACWLSGELWQQLQLDDFWRERLGVSREGTDWLDVLKTLVSYRLISPGSEWRLHREWYLHSAMADLLGRSGEAMELQSLYRCQDKLLAHKAALFRFLRERWQDLFHVEFEVLLYDLTSTYFECDPPASGKRRFGYSRDKRPDCVQVIIALVVTPDGLPLAYEVLAGNTSEKTTLKAFLDKIEKQYGQAKRIWVMDRGIPTEEQLKEMREANSPVAYLVPKPTQPVNAATFAFRLRKDKLRQAFRREGHYLLRSNLPEEDPARLWQHYVQLTEIEAVFRALKSDLAIRPIHHQKDSRIEAHIFVSFLAYCLYVTLRQRLRALAPGLTPRAVLEKMSAIQMVDVRVPTTDGRLLILPRYTQPETDHQMLLHELHLQLPAQPPPRILQQDLESVVEGENL